MGRTRIEWLRDPITGKAGYTINPIRGLCPVDCKDNQGKSYCYARRLYKRFGWDPAIRFEPEALLDLATMPNGSKVFIGSTMELFGGWIKPEWLEHIISVVGRCTWATIIFLTKQPQNLPK